MRAMAPLFGRTPAGSGTGRLESLSGFFVRAAAARNLGTSDAIRYLLIPNLDGGKNVRLLPSIGFFNRHVRVFDGLGGPAAAVAEAVGHLTDVSNLEQHTLIPWSRFLNPKMSAVLGDAGKRWCAQCFRDWRETGEPLYEPLAWRVALLERCPIHGIGLSNRCPNCGSPQPILTNVVPVGHCGGCGGPLERANPDLDTHAVDSVNAVSRAIEGLLAVHEKVARTGGPEGFLRLLDAAMARTSTYSERELSECLGLDERTIHDWRAGRRRPRFSYFMGVCLHLDVDPATVVLASSETKLNPVLPRQREIHLPWPANRSLYRRRRREYDSAVWTHVRRQLEQAIATGGRRSVTHIAIAVGVHHNSVRHRFPDMVKKLTALRLERTIRARRLVRERVARRVRGAVKDVVQAGEYPSLERALQTAGLRPHLKRRHFVREAWREERIRYGS